MGRAGNMTFVNKCLKRQHVSYTAHQLKYQELQECTSMLKKCYMCIPETTIAPQGVWCITVFFLGVQGSFHGSGGSFHRFHGKFRGSCGNFQPVSSWTKIPWKFPVKVSVEITMENSTEASEELYLLPRTSTNFYKLRGTFNCLPYFHLLPLEVK